MDMEDIEARLREIELTLLAHKGMLSIMLAQFAVSSDSMRATLEDVLAQAVEAREIHIPPTVGEVMPDMYRILLDRLGEVNKQLSVPLQPRWLQEKP